MISYNSKRKRKADNSMTKATKRFKNYKAQKTGELGDVVHHYFQKAKQPMKYEEILLQGVLCEALDAPWEDHPGTSPATIPLTQCAVCGKDGHTPAAHQGKALAGENNQPVKEDDFASTRDAGSGNLFDDEAVKCPDCGKEHAPSVPCSKKKLLFGDEKPAMTESQKKKKGYDFGKDVKAIARERVGQIPGKRVIVSKKDKPLKHKKQYDESTFDANALRRMLEEE